MAKIKEQEKNHSEQRDKVDLILVSILKLLSFEDRSNKNEGFVTGEGAGQATKNLKKSALTSSRKQTG